MFCWKPLFCCLALLLFMLEGMRVLELAQFYIGPFCTQILSDLGAEVIKVEPPFGEPLRFYDAVFAAFNRNKKSVVIDLKSEKGREKFMDLARSVDVIVEGFRPGVAKRLGVDYESVRKVNSSVIYCSISGFGQDSELRDLPVHDINVLSFAGVCRLTELKVGRPEDPNVQLSDFAAAVYAAISILAAYIRKLKTGEGTYIDLSMLDSVYAAIPAHTAHILNGLGNIRDFVENPGYGIYMTRDGYVSLGVLGEPHFWKELCKALQLDYGDLGYRERMERCEEIREAIQEKLKDMDTREVFELLRKVGVPIGIVNSVEEGAKLVEERGIIGEAEYKGKVYRCVSFPAKFSNYVVKSRGKVPKLDESL